MTAADANADKKIRVFIADDSATVRERLAGLLGDILGVELVGQAKDAAEALTAIHKLRPDVVILDIRMPAGSGIGVLRNLRRDDRPPKVIMLTNYPFTQYRKTCLEAGASFFFDKSSEFDQIPQALEQLSADAYGVGERWAVRRGSPYSEEVIGTMNEDIFEGMWKQAKGNVREWWGKLTDDDIERIGGKKDKLMGALQERYGWTRERAEQEVTTRMREYETTSGRRDMPR
jgi:CheY-like chemotaxis protein/uncharacterized protein YjbJ (UPF0337 family)